MNHHLVGALEPLGQDVLLQLQEELVPEREREREETHFTWALFMEEANGMESVEGRTARNPRLILAVWRREEVKTNGKGGRDETRGEEYLNER